MEERLRLFYVIITHGWRVALADARKRASARSNVNQVVLGAAQQIGDRQIADDPISNLRLNQNLLIEPGHLFAREWPRIKNIL